MTEQALGITAVERDTGLSKDTLRVWERRYGFPQPERDAAGDRLYPAAQVRRLHLLKQLLAQGHRPGRIVGASEAELQALLAQRQASRPSIVPGPAGDAEGLSAAQNELLDLIKQQRLDEFRRQLTQQLLREGLAVGVTQWIAPLARRVGELWMAGVWAVFEEHLFSECVQQTLRQAIQSLPQQLLHEHPRVLLTTFPGEAHGLGLLMAEAMMTLEGCHCLSVGVQTPLADIVLAARATRADVVALSFSGYLSTVAVNEGLSQLRSALPDSVALWAGGSSPALLRREDATGLRLVTRLQDVAAEVQRWREGALARP
ncbi:MerR family transcriptional regulator [Paucibacter sp. APW11]|uniref:MerR family transcriptional regulator n=1 Tax=Roseateles aquae TaxID=3077235 RepID=A0ABU3PA61_9BURK|nr:MerR family transcriptional regulator [Paucibacter sp. APW11]MDT8999471.1 MerR family transcriptional regulator [Paucibacter sp. APW11]